MDKSRSRWVSVRIVTYKVQVPASLPLEYEDVTTNGYSRMDAGHTLLRAIPRTVKTRLCDASDLGP